MSTTINFYSNNLRKDDLKNTTLTSSTSATGKIINELDVVNPTILVNISNVHHYNMVYIGALNRYYFIEDFEYTGYNNECKVKLHSAVLYNNYTDIIKNEVVVKKSTLEKNNYIYGSLPTMACKHPRIHKFKQLPLEDSFIITVIGG